MSSSDKEAVLATTSIQVPTGRAVRKWLGPPAERTSSGAEKTAEDGRQSSLKSEDPFLYYSCDQTRLSHLKAQEAAPQATAADATPERKTRISFELHPDLLLEGMIGDEDNALLDDASLFGGDEGDGAQGCGDLRDVTKIDSLQELEMLRALLDMM